MAAYLVSYAGLKASKCLHNIMLSNVLKCSMFFFDSTPKGRILARFSNDMNVLDYCLIYNFRQCLANVFKVRAFSTKKNSINTKKEQNEKFEKNLI